MGIVSKVAKSDLFYEYYKFWYISIFEKRDLLKQKTKWNDKYIKNNIHKTWCDTYMIHIDPFRLYIAPSPSLQIVLKQVGLYLFCLLLCLFLFSL